METERKYLDKRAEDMTKKCFDGLFQIWDKMGSENLRKDKVDYILKNFEDILEIYIIIEKKDMEKMKKNIQELHHRRRQLLKELGILLNIVLFLPNILTLWFWLCIVYILFVEKPRSKGSAFNHYMAHINWTEEIPLLYW